MGYGGREVFYELCSLIVSFRKREDNEYDAILDFMIVK